MIRPSEVGDSDLVALALSRHDLNGAVTEFLIASDDGGCYDATFVGAAGYNLTVAMKGTGKRREIHTTADAYTVEKY